MTFSIITVCFNSENTIERTIKSVLNQTLSDYEYLIVDGASTDRTLDIVKSYKSKFHGKLKLLSEPDKGIYNAMNKGIMLSTGEIIGIVNSDDWLEKDALETLEKCFQNDLSNRNKILTGEMLFHYSDGTTQLFPTNRERYEYYSKKYRMGLNHPATFVPKSVYNKIGLFNEQFRLYADADFIVRCYEANVDVLFINKILSNMTDGGASNNRSKLMIKDSILMISLHSKSKRERIWRIVKSYLFWYCKGLIPYFFVRKYRVIHN